MNPFSWIRSAARAAVVNGVMDGLNEVAPEEGSEPPADLAALRERFAAATALPAIAASTDDEPAETVSRRRK